MIWVGLAIVIATFYAIIKNYETRLVLFVSGAVMAILGGGLVGAFESFVKTMIEGGLVPTICTVMGFSYVMDYTGCTKHLVYFMTNLLKKVKILLVPGAALATFAINIALPSAAGAAAWRPTRFGCDAAAVSPTHTTAVQEGVKAAAHASLSP